MRVTKKGHYPNVTHCHKISVGICTYNRANLLRQTLESFQKISNPSCEWELVVVNNNSTDDTDQTIEQFKDNLPIVAGFQSIQGHAASRNKTIELATGEYLAWTDDDVLLDANWLRNYENAFNRHPEHGFFGGVIEPHYETPRPEWLVETWDKCKGAYALRELGDEPFEFTQQRLPYGANFAVKMELQKKYPFDLKTGRVGKQMLGEDESTVLRAMLNDGHKGIWCPDVKLKHFLPTDRLTESYLKRYFVGQGQANVMYGKVDRSKFAAWRDFLWSSILYRIKRRITEPDEWVSHMIRAALSKGELT